MPDEYERSKMMKLSERMLDVALVDEYENETGGYVVTEGQIDEAAQLEEENAMLKQALLIPIEESDYCYVCRNHGGASHSEDCPMDVLLTAEEQEDE